MPRKLSPVQFSSLSQRSRVLIFGLAFACIGTAFLLITQAATTTQTFSGKLTTRQTSQVFNITAESGQLNATLSSSGGATMTLTLLDKNGAQVASQTGPSPVTLSATTQAGNYKLQVSSPNSITSKGLPFTLQTTYEAAVAGDNIIPTTPSNLKATAVNGSQINLAWGASSDNVGVVGYDVYRDSVKVGESANNLYQDNGLTPLTTYKYYVIAKDAAGNSSKASAAVRVKTLGTPAGDTTPPTKPTNFTAKLSTSGELIWTDLDWTYSSDNSGIAPQYDLYVNGSLKYSNVAKPYSDFSITSGTTYSYYVVARDGAGNLSEPSVTVSITTPIKDTEKPSAPSNLTATPNGSKQISLTWTGSTDNIGVTGYKIFANGIPWTTVTETSFTHNFLTPSTNYSYYVVALDAANNNSDPSGTVTTRTPDADTEPPTAPEGFVGTAISSNQVNLVWNSSTDNVGVAGYKLYRNDTYLATLNPSITNYEDTSLIPNSAYRYRIEVFDADGNTNMSYAQRIYTPSAIAITVTSPSSGSTQSGTISVSGTTSSSSGQVSKVEVAGSYGSYQPAVGTTNWTATLDTTKILDSTTPIIDDPQHPEPINRYVFIKATDETTGDFKITSVPIIIKNDTQLPTATVTSPASGSNQSGLYTITGTASDNAGVKKVLIQNSSGQGGEALATGTTNWTATVTTNNDSIYKFNTVKVYDVNGNSSKTPFSVNHIGVTYTGTISGRTYKDQNNNRLYDSGDQALANHTIHLWADVGGYGQYIENVASDSDGKFSFSGLQDGKYNLTYAAGDWWTIDDSWFPNIPAVTVSRFSPKQTVSLAGAATADFSWRPIGRTPDPNQPGASLLITSLTGPNGLTAKQYDDAILAQEIYDRASAGKLIGAESSSTSVGEGVYFGGGFAGTTAAGYGTDENGKCTDASGSSAVYWPYWYGYANDGDEGVLFHEYGHSWQNYWSCLHQDVGLAEYMIHRGLDLTDPRINTNREWNLEEIAAEDYRQLFSAKPILERQANGDIPRATEIPGFKDYLTNTYRTAR